MTTRSAARRSLLYALLELERVDDGALDAAFQSAQRAAFQIWVLRGTTAPANLSPAPAGTTASKADGARIDTSGARNLDRSSVPVSPVPPAATGLHSDGRSDYLCVNCGCLANNHPVRWEGRSGPKECASPVAAPPSDTRPPGNRESGGGNP